MADDPIFRRGARIADKWIIEGELGRGGMAVVAAARHADLGHEVAIKALLPESLRHGTSADRLLREARAAAGLQSEHATRVFDVGRLPSGAPFMVLERLRGMDLHALLQARGPLPPAEVVRAVHEACDAVAEAHERGIVHRDLKPSNLFLARRRDGSAVVKVLDFGIAKASAGLEEAALTTTSSSLGTPLYMAPEQVLDAKNVTAAVDVWALGVTMYELLTDAIPWDVQSVHALLAKIVTEPPVALRRRRDDLPPALEAIIMRCLARAPEARFPDARTLAAALAPFASPTPLTLPAPHVDDAPTEHDESVEHAAAVTDLAVPFGALGDTKTNPLREHAPITAEAATRRQPAPEIPSRAARTDLEWDVQGHASERASPMRRRWVLPAAAGAALLAVLGAGLSMRGVEPPSAAAPSVPTAPSALDDARDAPPRPRDAPPPEPSVVASGSPPAGGSVPSPSASTHVTAPVPSTTPSTTQSPPRASRPRGARAGGASPAAPAAVPTTSSSSSWGPLR